MSSKELAYGRQQHERSKPRHFEVVVKLAGGALFW